MSVPPKLLDRVREAIRTRHSSRRTEQAYVDWTRRFIVFHDKRHPSMMGAREISAFLSWLAVRRHVSASTQNQALSAILFLYRDVLAMDVGAIDHLPRARMPANVPIVLSRDEVAAIMKRVGGTMWIIVGGRRPSVGRGCSLPANIQLEPTRPPVRAILSPWRAAQLER